MCDPELKLEVARLTNLACAFGWTPKSVDKTDTEVIIAFSKPRTELLPEDAVGAD